MKVLTSSTYCLTTVVFISPNSIFRTSWSFRFLPVLAPKAHSSCLGLPGAEIRCVCHYSSLASMLLSLPLRPVRQFWCRTTDCAACFCSLHSWRALSMLVPSQSCSHSLHSVGLSWWWPSLRDCICVCWGAQFTTFQQIPTGLSGWPQAGFHGSVYSSCPGSPLTLVFADFISQILATHSSYLYFSRGIWVPEQYLYHPESLVFI